MNKRSGAKKNLLRRDGIASDADGIKDDGSSSLSERQEKAKSKSKKKFSARALFRKIGTRSGTEEVSNNHVFRSYYTVPLP